MKSVSSLIFFWVAMLHIINITDLFGRPPFNFLLNKSIHSLTTNLIKGGVHETDLLCSGFFCLFLLLISIIFIFDWPTNTLQCVTVVVHIAQHLTEFGFFVVVCAIVGSSLRESPLFSLQLRVFLLLSMWEQVPEATSVLFKFLVIIFIVLIIVSTKRRICVYAQRSTDQVTSYFCEGNDLFSSFGTIFVGILYAIDYLCAS